jgi:hypothetical protein
LGITLTDAAAIVTHRTAPAHLTTIDKGLVYEYSCREDSQKKHSFGGEKHEAKL